MFRSLLLSSACILVAIRAGATDRVVSPTGTYNTISSAITASSDGDRVLVTSGNYAENLSINKSISILPHVEGTRYTVNGWITLQSANGKSITISGGRVMSGFRSAGSYTDRTEVRILDCYATQCDLDEPSIRLELYRDSIVSEVRISSGTISGCVLMASALVNTIVKLQGTSVLPDDTWIIGNSFGSSTSLKKGILVTAIGTFHIENNVFVDNNSGSSAIDLALPSDHAAPASTILNNSFIKMTAENVPAISNSTSALFTLVVKNNAVVRFNGGVITSISYWTQLTQSHNTLSGPTWLNLATGEPVNGSPLINAGDPDPRYLDLDLTTNDAGCYGGSNSRANFTTGMGSAVVGFMRAPRVVSQGDAVNISVTGFDR